MKYSTADGSLSPLPPDGSLSPPPVFTECIEDELDGACAFLSGSLQGDGEEEETPSMANTMMPMAG